ncbi:MAG TPA: hypothetical protein VHV76_08385 [Mycobacteriales bacterium]|nr:hypothetical protein [Mycobacteriales bacterium]
MSSNFTPTMPAPRAVVRDTAVTRVVPASARTMRSVHVVPAMWSKHLTLAPIAAVAVKANRNKGAVGAPGFWDPV